MTVMGRLNECDSRQSGKKNISLCIDRPPSRLDKRSHARRRRACRNSVRECVRRNQNEKKKKKLRNGSFQRGARSRRQGDKTRAGHISLFFRDFSGVCLWNTAFLNDSTRAIRWTSVVPYTRADREQKGERAPR